MKKTINLLSFVFVVGLLTPQLAQAQIFVRGNTFFCDFGCETYRIISPTTDNYSWVLYDFAGNILTTATGTTADLCFDFQTSHFTVTNNETGQSVNIFVEVSESDVFPLASNAADLCPANSNLAGCDRVCANSTVTYWYPEISDIEIDWQVTGAKSFQAEGNKVVVDWGEGPGYGRVEGSYDFNQSGNFGVVMQQIESPAGSSGLTALVVVSMGSRPYPFTYTWDDGLSYTLNQDRVTRDGLSPGLHSVTVTNARGIELEVSLYLDNNNSNFPFEEKDIVEGTRVPSCRNGFGCTGMITLQAISPNRLYTYAWSDSQTTARILDLCPGKYYATIVDDYQHTISTAYYLGCYMGECSYLGSKCVNILEDPTADFAALPAVNDSLIRICKGQTVYFQNQSEAAASYLWNFDLGNHSSEENPAYTFETAGTFDISLIAYNACGCSDTTYMKVEVEDATAPELDCLGTVCAGEVVTYTSSTDCAIFNWRVIGDGLIVDGGGPTDDFITIDWQSGPEGIIELLVDNCSSTACREPSLFRIPILDNANGEISGVEIVCPDEIAVYSVPPYSASTFFWEVTAGQIIEGQGTNQVRVRWGGYSNSSEVRYVRVRYDNCYLGCAGSAEKEVLLKPLFYTSGPIEVCQRSVETYESLLQRFQNPAIDVHWYLLNENQDTVWRSSAPASSVSIDFDLPPGLYQLLSIRANPADACSESYSQYIEVRALPPVLSGIAGEATICPEEWYSYEAQGVASNHLVNWQINNGGNWSIVQGNPVNIRWGNSPPYQLFVSQSNVRGLDCSSDTIGIVVQAIPNVTLTGEDQLCLEEVASYQATTFGAVDYNWTIDPPQAGVIVSNPNAAQIDVQWYQAGNASLSVDLCGQSATLNVVVAAWPEPVVDHPLGLCPGELGSVRTTTPFTTYSWFDEDEALVSNDPNPDLMAGYYRLEVSNAFGCLGDTSFFIEPHPEPFVRISVPIFEALCPGGPPVRIHALMTDAGYDYQWYRDGVPIGGNIPTFDASQMGTYWVVVTDQNACTAESNRLRLGDCAAIGGTCVNGRCVGPPNNCSINGDLDFEIRKTTECRRHFYFNTSSGFIPGSIRWSFGDPASGANNVSTDFSPQHTFEGGARFYVIKLRASFRDVVTGEICSVEIWKNDTIPIVADFEALGTCAGSPIQFNDLSTFLPFTSISSWRWNFGDPASGVLNRSSVANPTHTYTTPGSYNVRLIVEEQDGCRSEIERTIEVFAPPNIQFDPPTESCAGDAMNFVANVPPEVVDVYWDFGEPSSGEANTSQSVNTFHAYSAAGVYTVTLMATDIYGCSSSTTETVVVAANGLTGSISLSGQSPICEGESITLTAITNGSDIRWSTGATTSSITVAETGIYGVTISDANGCTIVPTPVPIDVLSLPQADIRAVEYNQFEQPIAYFYDFYEICEGEDVFLEIENPVSTHLYRWSNGQIGTSLEFSEDNAKLLSAGDHTYSITVTDRRTRCRNEVGPFLVRVHALPDSIQITANTTRTICENTPVTFSVANPDTSLQYLWSNGEGGLSITTSLAGEYFVRGITPNGCYTESNRLDIKAGPDINQIPNGCHVRCRPDTLCFPDIPNIDTYQWYFNGSPVPAPEGQMAEFLPQESGTYYLEMTDTDGCLVASADLNIELSEGFGSINGAVYFDLNENGVIDAGDTLMTGVPIRLLDTGLAVLDSTNSNGGLILFDGLPSASDYVLLLDSLGLPAGTRAVQVQQSANLLGCDDVDSVQWLVVPFCTSQTESLTLLACTGDSALYNGNKLSIGSQTDFSFTSEAGCDSIVRVMVNAVPVYAERVSLESCAGSRIDYNGMSFPSDTLLTLRYSTIHGCDSLVELRVSPLPIDSSSLRLEVCGGGSTTHDGVVMRAGESRLFRYQNMAGCDSLMLVMVDSVPEYREQVDLAACMGSHIEYNGLRLPADTSLSVRYTTAAGCDSVVNILVSPMPTDSSGLQLEVCGTDSIIYDGVAMRAGESRLFRHQNVAGCDSLMMVEVDSMTVYRGQVDLEICAGDRITYNGLSLPADTSLTLRYATIAGCDSLIEVAVSPLAVDSISLTLEACDNKTVSYLGTILQPGDEHSFQLTNRFGCDSTVMVRVVGVPLYNNVLQLEACQGSSASFNGVQIPTDSSMQFTFQSVDGCDSVVNVEVLSLPLDSTTIDLITCEGSTAFYNGTSIPAGTSRMFAFTNQHECDSMVMVRVAGSPIDTTYVPLELCPGDSIDYLGNILYPGSLETFRLTDAMGCDSFVVVSIDELPDFDVTVESIKQVCKNEMDGRIELSTVGGVGPFRYSLDGNRYQVPAYFEKLPPGPYQLFVRDGNGCIQELTGRVEEVPAIDLRTQDAIISCELDSLTLLAEVFSDTTSVKYLWQDGSGGSEFTIYEPGIYWVEVSNECETVFREILVAQAQQTPESPIYMPNAFSPNNDGYNDLYRGYAASGVDVMTYELQIFDRWGNKLFQTHNIDQGWNGIFKGQDMDPAVFVWFIRARVNSCGNEMDIFKKGGVTLLR